MTEDESQRGLQRCPVSSWSSCLIDSSKCDSTSAKCIQLPFSLESLVGRQAEPCHGGGSIQPFVLNLLHLRPPSRRISRLLSGRMRSPPLCPQLKRLAGGSRLPTRCGAAPPGMTAGTTDECGKKQNHIYKLERSRAEGVGSEGTPDQVDDVSIRNSQQDPQGRSTFFLSCLVLLFELTYWPIGPIVHDAHLAAARLLPVLLVDVRLEKPLF